MTDWPALAHALDLDIPEDQLRRITPVLEDLETSFRPLVAQLSADAEPAVVFLAGVPGRA